MKLNISVLLLSIALLSSAENQALAISHKSAHRLVIDNEKKKQKNLTAKLNAGKKDKKIPKKENVEIKKTDEEEEAPSDDSTTGTSQTAFNGADEDEVIDNIFTHYAKEAMNAAG